MFRVALVLIKYTMGRPEQIAECPGLYETMEKIRNVPYEVMREEFLVREVGWSYYNVLLVHCLSFFKSSISLGALQVI